MLVRLMQSFSSISLELDSFPPGSLPPEEFKLAPGRKGIDKIWPKTTLTLYVAVCVIIAHLLGNHSSKVIIQGGLWVKMQEVNNA